MAGGHRNEVSVALSASRIKLDYRPISAHERNVKWAVHGEFAFRRQWAVQTGHGNGFAKCTAQGWPASGQGCRLFRQACRRPALGVRIGFIGDVEFDTLISWTGLGSFPTRNKVREVHVLLTPR